MVGHDRLEEECGQGSVCRGRLEEEEEEDVRGRLEEEVEDDVRGRLECSGEVDSALVCITEDDICRGRSGTQAQICTVEPRGRETS